MQQVRVALLLVSLTGVWTSSASAVKVVNLRGAGATFPAEVYRAWMPAYTFHRREFVDLKMTYDPTGSSDGKRRILVPVDETPEVEYAGSDSPMTEEEYEEFPEVEILPTMAGGVVLAFNLRNVTSLVLSREVIVGIYNGSVARWDDPALAAINPGLPLPDQDIVVVARADSSGTTQVFTSALSSFSAEWASTHGSFSAGLDADDNPLFWPPGAVDIFARTTAGVAGVLMSLRNTIGYLAIADADSSSIPYAHIINRAGNPVIPDRVSVQSAMTDHEGDFEGHVTAELVDSHSPQSYPIAAYTYFLLRKRNDDLANCDAVIELVRYVEWFIDSETAQMECERFKMVPLSDSVGTAVKRRVLDEITCRGESVYEMVRDQIHQEKIAMQKWRLPVFISVPIMTVLFILLVTYIVWQYVKMNRAILEGHWRIPEEDIKFIWNREHRTKNNFLKALSSASVRSVGVANAMSAPNVSMVGHWRDNTVCLRDCDHLATTSLPWEAKRQVLWLRDRCGHPNLQRFFAVSHVDQKMYLVSELPAKGTLTDILQNDRYKLDVNFKYSMAIDVGKGMRYLHDNGVIHGRLNSNCCVIDSRWNVKVGDWEYMQLEKTLRMKNKYKIAPQVTDVESDDNMKARTCFWAAPELLMNKGPPTKFSDVYSFSILLVEIFTRSDPYCELLDRMEPIQVVEAIKLRKLRPDLTGLSPESAKLIIRKTWNESALQRPQFSQVIKLLKIAKPSKKGVLDCMMEALEDYVTHLEEKVEERTGELAKANESMEKLLNQILPPSVAKRLAEGHTVEPEYYDSATIYFSDIVGFTTISSNSTPMQIVNMLNDLYTTFDAIIDNHDVYKVETIGDAYMVISGLPNKNGSQHVVHISAMALDLMAAADRFEIHHFPDTKLQLRAGVHSGPVVAGVVGSKMPRYCLFGDTVNTASRMESTSEAMKIQISETSERLLADIGGFIATPRGQVEVKGKGVMKTFFLAGRSGLPTETQLPSLTAPHVDTGPGPQAS